MDDLPYISYKGFIDKTWTGFVLFKEYPEYDRYKSEIFGDNIAVADLDEKMIYIDGEQGVNPQQLRAIEAHEIGHYLAEHKCFPFYSEEQETEADLMAIKILEGTNNKLSAEVINDHGLDFEDLRPELQEKVETYLKNR